MPRRPSARRRPVSGATTGRGRGRPAQELKLPDVRDALLSAARKLFARRGFHEVSTREIARAAEVNPAMIHYYFGDKEGLYRAMLEKVFDRLFGEARQVAASSVGNSPISELVELYAKTLTRDPWIPRLMIREVLSDGAPFREEFIERFAGPASVLVPSVMQREQDAHHVRNDLDPQLATLSLMGMILFPFLAFPVASRVFGLELNDDFRQRFIAHTVNLFFEGAKAKEESR